MRLSTIHRSIARGSAHAARRTAANRWDGVSDPRAQATVAALKAATSELDTERAKRDAKNARERARRAAAKAAKLVA
jgi:hypothetical protein